MTSIPSRPSRLGWAGCGLVSGYVYWSHVFWCRVMTTRNWMSLIYLKFPSALAAYEACPWGRCFQTTNTAIHCMQNRKRQALVAMIGSMKLLLCQEGDPTPPLNRASLIQTHLEKQLREWLWNVCVFCLNIKLMDFLKESMYNITYISIVIWCLFLHRIAWIDLKDRKSEYLQKFTKGDWS